MSTENLFPEFNIDYKKSIIKSLQLGIENQAYLLLLIKIQNEQLSPDEFVKEYESILARKYSEILPEVESKQINPTDFLKRKK